MISPLMQDDNCFRGLLLGSASCIYWKMDWLWRIVLQWR